MSRSQFHSIKLFILRHAWLNLWDKHMTTGRINQVTFFVCYPYHLTTPHPRNNTYCEELRGSATRRGLAYRPGPTTANESRRFPKPVNSWRIIKSSLLRRQRLFDPSVTFHYIWPSYEAAARITKVKHAASRRHTFDVSNSLTPKLNVNGAESRKQAYKRVLHMITQRVDIQTLPPATTAGDREAPLPL